MTRQVCVARQDILRGRPTEHIVDEVSIAGSEPGPLRIFVSQVKLDTRCAVKKEAPRLSVCQDQRKRNRDIQVILQRGMATRRIDIPEKLMGPRFIQFTRAFPAAKIEICGHMPLIHTHGGPQSSRWICQIDNRRSLGRDEPAHTKLWIFCSEGASCMDREADRQRTHGEMSSCNRCCDGDFAVSLPDGHWPWVPIPRDHSLRAIASGPTMREKANPKQIRRERSHLDCCRASTQADL